MLFHAKLCQSEQSVTIRAIRRPHRSDVSRISIGAPSPCCRTVTDLDPSGDGSGDRVLSTPMLQCYADFFKTRPPRIASNTLPVVGSGLVAPGFIHSRKGEIAEMKEMPAAAGWLVHSPICTHLSRQKPMASVGIARRHLPFAIRNWQYRLAIHQKVLVPQGERKLSVPCPAEADLER